MPVIAAMALYILRLVRRPVDSRLKRREGGPIAIVGGLGLLVVVWLRFAPEDVGWAYLAGEIWGVSAIYLMSSALVLATRAQRLEPWFGGLDRMYRWHRWCAAVAVGLLVIPHATLTTVAPEAEPPQLMEVGLVLGGIALLGLLCLTAVSFRAVGDSIRLRYGRWLNMHRFAGFFVLAAAVHGLMLDDVIAESIVHRLLFVAVALVALASYGYTELLMRRRVPKMRAVVSAVDRLSPDVLKVTLQCDKHMDMTPGQFIGLKMAGSGWHEHPFSVAGQLPDGGIQLVIRVAGEETARMHRELEAGMSGTLTGPYGMFDHTLGGHRQIWIAGGVGIAPFLGWLVGPDIDLPECVDFFYVTANESSAFFAAELDQAARLHPQLRVHHIHTNESGRLTLERIASDVSQVDHAIDPATDVFLCGPRPMTVDLARALHRVGIPRDRIHFEFFWFR